MTGNKCRLIFAILLILRLLTSISLLSMAQNNQASSSLPVNGKIYVNANTGNHSNSGTEETPLLSSKGGK